MAKTDNNPLNLFGGQFETGLFIWDGDKKGKGLFNCAIQDVLKEEDLICHEGNLADIFGFTMLDEACLDKKYRVYQDFEISLAGKIGEGEGPQLSKPDGIRGGHEYPTTCKYGTKDVMSEEFQYWMQNGCPCDSYAIRATGIGTEAERARRLLRELKYAEMAEIMKILMYAYCKDVPGNAPGAGGQFGDALIGPQDAQPGFGTNQLAADGLTITGEECEEDMIEGFRCIFKEMKDKALCQETPSCNPMCPADCHTIYAGRRLAKVLRKVLGIISQELGCCMTTNVCGENIAVHSQIQGEKDSTISEFLYKGQGFNLVELPFFSDRWFQILKLDATKLPEDSAGTRANPEYMYFIMDRKYLMDNEVFVKVRGQAPMLRTWQCDNTEDMFMASKARFGYGHFGIGGGIWGGFTLPVDCSCPEVEA